MQDGKQGLQSNCWSESHLLGTDVLDERCGMASHRSEVFDTGGCFWKEARPIALNRLGWKTCARHGKG